MAGRLRVLPAGVGRHPADQRLHRQVGGLRGRAVRPAPGRWWSSRSLSSVVAAFFYVRVIVLMFFSEPERRRPPSSTRRRVLTAGDHRGRRRPRPLVLGIVPGPGARPGGPCGRIHPVSPTSEPAGRAGAARHRRGPRRAGCATGWRRSRRRSPGTSRSRDAVRHRGGRATCSPPAASGSGRCWCCSPPRPATGPTPTRSSTAACVVELTHLGVALPRRRDGRGRAAPRRRLGQRPLGQPRRDPHRRLPVREVLRAHRRPRPGGGADPGARPSPGWSRARSSRPSQPGRGRGPARSTTSRRRRQDRLADRHLGPVRRPASAAPPARSRRR